MTIAHSYVIQTEAHFSPYYYAVTLTLTSRLLLLDTLIFCRNVSQASWLITAVGRNVLVQTGTGAKNIKAIIKASCLVFGNRPVTAGIKFLYVGLTEYSFDACVQSRWVNGPFLLLCGWWEGKDGFLLEYWVFIPEFHLGVIPQTLV
jgi:hypothetical protein